jgi:hypothetical protein
MRNDLSAINPEQLCTLQTIFNQAWLRANGSININASTDWEALRNEVVCRVMDYAHTNLTDEEIVSAVLTSLGIF